MEISQLIEALGKLNASKRFIANWNNFHEGQNIVDFMNNIGIETFAIKFNDVTFSFIWCSTPEGMYFWRHVDYMLQTIVFPNKAKIVKQAIILLKKHGYTTNLIGEGLSLESEMIGLALKNMHISFWPRVNLPITADVDDNAANPKLILSTMEYIIGSGLYKKKETT